MSRMSGICWRRYSASLVLPDGRVDRDVARREALLHLDHFLLAHVEALGDELRAGREALALEPLALLGEVEEELALRLRGADLHQAPVVHDVADDVGADPPHRVGGEADAAVGVEVLDRLEQADVPLLDEVEEVVEGAPAGSRRTPPRAPRPRPSGGRPLHRPAPAPSGARRGRPARRPSDRARRARRDGAAARSGSPGAP